MRINRREAGLLLGGLAGAAFTGSAFAQADYPTRPIKIVIGFPAGSGADTVTRFFAARITELAAQPLVVENRPGAFSSIAFANVGGSKPDGYTILWTGSSIMAGGRHMVRNMPFDPDKDFTPVAAFADFPFVLVVGAKSSVKSASDLISAVRAKEKATFGHFNPPAYLATAYFNSQNGLRPQPVVYKGAADALPDLENGTIDFMVMDGAFAIGAIKSGKIRALAVTSAKRAAELPDVPTFIEAGLGSFNFTPWWGAWFPAGTPKPIVDKFTGWFKVVAAQPQTADFLRNVAVIPVAEGPEEVVARIKSDRDMWDKLAKEVGMTPQ
jgi:tripartite-type tricarboxylate transporter receptor subunit TctC